MEDIFNNNYKKKIGFAFPEKLAYESFSKDNKIIYFFEEYFQLYEKDKRTKVYYDFEFNNIDLEFLGINIPDIRNEINNWSTLWTRWIGESHRYEIFREKAIFHISKIIISLSNLNIACVVFHTSVSHHFDSFCIYCACRLLKIPCIYLYSIVINGDLLPLIQTKYIESRKPLGKKISSTKYGLIIENFITNFKNKKSPKTNPKRSKINTNFYLSLFFLFYLEIKNKLHKILFKVPQNYFYNEHDFLSRLSMLLEQRKYIKYYRKIEIQKPKFKNKKEQPKLIIYAQYQPEATTMPEGGKYISHIDVALTLRLKGYKEKIFYKEHPASLMYLYEMENKISDITRIGIHRYPEYLNTLREIGCEFISQKFKIDNNSSNILPVTISGTIALERSLEGFRTIVFGQPWFKDIPGIIHIDSINSFKNINPAWVFPDDQIEKNAKIWLEENLSNKTITNRLKIGSENPFIKKSNFRETQDELHNLFQILKKDYLG